jgi:ribosome-binding protein aMBF1 (putative translation factor)
MYDDWKSGAYRKEPEQEQCEICGCGTDNATSIRYFGHTVRACPGCVLIELENEENEIQTDMEDEEDAS